MESAFEDDITLLDIHSGAVAVRVVAGMTTALLGQRPAAPTDAGPEGTRGAVAARPGTPNQGQGQAALEEGRGYLVPLPVIGLSRTPVAFASLAVVSSIFIRRRCRRP